MANGLSYPFGAVVVQGSDGYVIQTVDNRFNYQFDCFACSHPPRQIFAIEGGKGVDASGRPTFVPLFREDARRLEETMDAKRDLAGFWAGYVATKARIGEFDEGPGRQCSLTTMERTTRPLKDAPAPTTRIAIAAPA